MNVGKTTIRNNEIRNNAPVPEMEDKETLGKEAAKHDREPWEPAVKSSVRSYEWFLPQNRGLRRCWEGAEHLRAKLAKLPHWPYL